jgi:hypothetical protein
LQDRWLPFGGPSPAAVRALAQSAFVDEDDRAALLAGFFLMAGQRCLFQWRICSSFRSKARPVGRWQLHPSEIRIRQTWPGWYLMRNSCSIRWATRAEVQRPVSYPKASGPRWSKDLRRSRWAGLNRGLRPARPACRRPSRPPSAICRAQRLTLCALTFKRRATLDWLNPSASNSAAWMRRRSKASKSRLTPAGLPMLNRRRRGVECFTILCDSQ